MKYYAPGTPPATLIAKPKTGTGAPVLTLIQYDGDSIFEEEFDTFEGLMRRFDPSKVNWINVDSLSDVELLRKLGDMFNIHPLALEDVLNTTQRPKVEQFANRLC